MKKILLILGIIILFLSCDKEDIKKTCNCANAKMTTFEYGTGYFYITNLPVDCETGRPSEEWLRERNYIFVRCE